MPYPSNQPWDLDVRNWGAKGDGTTDDTISIQNELDAAESYGGGIIFFPPGTYIISATLKLPSRVYIKGVAGTTYNYIDTSPINFFARVNTILKLKTSLPSGRSMIEPKTPSDFSSAGIENIILDGNKNSQQLGSGYYGIKILDAVSGQRSQMVVRNVIVYQVKGTGFYGGINQHELFLDWVTAFDCDSDGIVLRGEDIKGTRIASGKNGGVGIKFPGSGSTLIASGSGRFVDVDSWSNLIGMEFSDTSGLFFFGLEIAANKQFGLHIYSTQPQPPGFSPGQIRIFRGIFFDNSGDLNNGYSDIKLEANVSGFGPWDIGMIGCEFRGSFNSNKPKYAIEDSSTTSRRIVISGGFFRKSNFGTGISNKPQALRDCFDYDTGDLLTESELHYAFVDSVSITTYNIVLGDAFLLVNAFTANITVNLPPLTTMATGRVFYITKQDSVVSRSVAIQAAAGQTINGVSSIILSGSPAYQTYMIIHGGSAWVAIKMA